MKQPTREEMLKSYRIDTVDDRGYFITNGGINGGWYYLYDDGKLHNGVLRGEGNPFWPTKEAAQAFYDKWRLAE